MAKQTLGMLPEERKANLTPAQYSPKTTSGIAVIGLACYYPGANTIRELWENILARRIQFRRMLDQRLPLKDYYDEDPKAPEKTYVTKAAFIENFGFDWSGLRIPKKTFESTDIVHWLALDTALKAFGDAGYEIGKIPIQDTGVIVGNTLTGEQTRSQSLRLRWPYVQKVLNTTLVHLGISPEDRNRVSMEMEKSYKSAFYPITEDSLAGGLANTIAGRICNYLNLKGGGYVVDGACSSSLLAIATAANALKMKELELALAGGVDVSLDPFELVGFAKAGALAKDKMCVYDRQANGFLPGEGCGFVILKRLEDALRDHNYIYAVIKGWGISSDGKGGIMEPSSSGQTYAIKRAYKDTDYAISDVDFIEGHGTGTPKGDQVELEGIATAIEEFASKDRKTPCGITSFKSIVGHTKAAAGVGGLIKAVLAVNQRILPPTASCQDPNEILRRKARHLYPIILGEVLPPNRTMRAGISSAGFGGINCHVTIESMSEPSEKIKPNVAERSLFVSNQETELFVFSARTINHIRNIIRRSKDDVRNISFAEMADLASFLSERVKSHLPIKAAIVTDSPEHLYEALILAEKELENISLPKGSLHRAKTSYAGTHIVIGNSVRRNRVGFLYPGQGSQRLNMTRRLVERFKWARDLLELSTTHAYIYKPVDRFLGSQEQEKCEKTLAETQITQPALILSSLIWSNYLSRLGIEPHAVGGHSLGELSAFHKAGAFAETTLIRFAELRGKLMAANRYSGGMASLLCSTKRAEDLLSKVDGTIVVANINSPNQIVISGGKRELEEVIEIANKEHISAYHLNVSNAFHSSFMEEASEGLRAAPFLQSKFEPSSINLYSCMDGKKITDKIELGEYFARQALSQVNFLQLIETMSRDCDVLVEVGPGRVLTDLVRAINKSGDIPCFPIESTPDNDGDVNIALAELFVRDVQISWGELYRNRLIRPFVTVSRKHFIGNQCERPLHIEQAQITSPEVRTQRAINVGSESPGRRVGTKDEAIAEQYDDIASLMIALTQKMTGFDKNSISLESRLLDDLNLDSIKAAELVGEAARILGVAGHLDPSQLSSDTLGQIRDRLQQLVNYQRSMRTAGSIDLVPKRYQHRTWVRYFAVEYEHQEITTNSDGRFNEFGNVLILSEGHNQDVIREIEKHLSSSGVKVRSLSYSEIPKENLTTFSDVDCSIFMLPTNAEGNKLNKVALRQSIDTLHKAIVLSLQGKVGEERVVAFVQYGCGNYGDNDVLKNIRSCCARAIASTLHLERPDLRVRIIDCDERSPKHDIATKIIDELKTAETFSAVGYDHQLKRRVPVYKKSEPIHYRKRNIEWSKEDVVLVTGGGKGITAECALEFARSTGTRMILVGRSPVPIDAKDERSEIVKTVSRFRREGLECHYYQCDITDEEAVKRFVSEIRGKFGRIKGFIHGAGLNSLQRLKQMGVDEAYSESLAKVIGAAHILDALEQDPPLLVMAMTSVIGVTGMEGSGWYGFANEVLNLYLRKFRNEHKQTQVQAIAYSVWDEIGMGVRLGSLERLSEKGVAAIPVNEGTKCFKQLVEYDPGIQQVIVVGRVAGVDTWKSPSSRRLDNLRFIEEIKYFLPDVELIVRARLNVQDDPYLLDHNWKGSLLLPFVFGLEAMTQAVAFVTGKDTIHRLRIRDINLERPIPINPDTGTTIEIRAYVLPVEDKKTNRAKVKVEVYVEQTDYQQPHFSAIFETDPQITGRSPSKKLQLKAKNIVDLTIETDVYGPVLFQGKMFHCIEQIHGLYYDRDKNMGKCVLTCMYNRSTRDYLERRAGAFNKFLIGDPFFIDSMLQSMQLIVAQDSCVPRNIEKIELILKAGKEERGKCLVSSSLKKVNTDFYRGDSYVNTDQISVKIANCRLKVLNTNINSPSANDLVNPSKRDQRIIDEAVSKILDEVGFIPPVIKCGSFREFGELKGDERRQAELPVVREAVLELLNRTRRRISLNRVKIGWLRSGKPIVEGTDLDEVGVSISHTQNFLICAVGQGSQGCDLEIIEERSSEKWRALLGRPHSILLDKWKDIFNDLNARGTAIWSAIEAIRKAKNVESDLEIEHIGKEGGVVLKILNSNRSFVIITPIKLTTLKQSILSLYVETQTADKPLLVSDTRQEKENLLKKFGFDEDVFGIQVDYSGPQGQYVFSKQYPVTFKTNKLRSRRVYFTNYFDWMGELREYSIYPIMDKLANMLETGGWGLATNWVKLQILGDLRGNDVVTGRIWMEEVDGANESVFDICFEWRKRIPEGHCERIAFCKQRTSWIKITGHGQGFVDKLPESIRGFMDSMRPRRKEAKPLDELKEPFRELGIGKTIRQFKNKHVMDYTFDTSLENSNLVGNIYFSNYPKWLGAVEDLYFYKLIPEYYRGEAANGEFICLNCDIDHLREAMPFDKVLTRMYLNTLYQNGMDLAFEFYLDRAREATRKLAVARQTIIWVKRKHHKIESDEMPSQIMNHLIKDIAIPQPTRR